MGVRFVCGSVRKPLRYASGANAGYRGDSGSDPVEPGLTILFGRSGAPAGYQASGLVWAISDGWIGSLTQAQGLSSATGAIGATGALLGQSDGVGLATGAGNRGIQRIGSSAGVASGTAAISARGGMAGIVRIGANPGAVDIASEILDIQLVETGLTVRESLKIMLSAMAGKVAISGSTVTFRAADDSRNVIVATVDAAGRRTTVTLTP